MTEKEKIVRWFRWHARCARIDADGGLWEGIEDQAQEAIDEFNGYADAIERGDHLSGDHLIRPEPTISYEEWRDKPSVGH